MHEPTNIHAHTHMHNLSMIFTISLYFGTFCCVIFSILEVNSPGTPRKSLLRQVVGVTTEELLDQPQAGILPNSGFRMEKSTILVINWES